MSSPPSGPDNSWQPKPGTYKSAPTYGQPPRKSQAGLIIALIVVLSLVVLGALGLVAYRLISGHNTASPGPTTSVAPPPSSTKTTVRPTSTPPVSARPTSPPKSAAATSPTDVARQFVTQLNANNVDAAADLACADSRALIPVLMRTLLAPPTKLTAGAPTGQSPTFIITLTGTTHHSTVTGFLVIRQSPPTPTCVTAFQITPP